jgi:hypothetical protein
MIQNSVPKSAFVPRQDLRGELTTRECIVRDNSGYTSIGVFRYGSDFKYFRGDLVFLASNIKRDGSAKVARDCERKSNIVQQLVGRTTRPRTGVDAIARLECSLGTEWFKRGVELLHTTGITNNRKNARIENCIYVFIL